MAAKKKAAKKKVAKRPKYQCPDEAEAFFGKINDDWAAPFAKWATEVESCYEAVCGTDARRKKLVALCKQFSKFADDAKKWADDVEDCFQSKCVNPPDHTLPPPPPF